MPAVVQAGDNAPEFSLPDQSGREVRLSDLLGRPVVLWFYPADFTPGCSLEARAFAKAHPEFEKRGAAVLGISTQGTGSHAKFADACGIPFPLLADPDRRAIRAYDAAGALGLPKRVTVVVGPDGRVQGRYASRLRPTKHPGAALRILDED